MNDADLHRLDEVAEVIDSLHQTPSYVEEGLPMVRVTDIKGGSIDLKETFKVTQNVYEEFTKKYQPQRDDILMTRVGSYGSCAYVNTDDKFCLGQNTVVIKPKIDSEFLYYCLIASNVKNQIESCVTGSTQKTISLKNIRSLEIPIPSKDEVISSIAKNLSDIDKKIELNNKINAELEAMAKLIYDYWFVQFDFPDAKGKPYKSSGGKMVYNEALKREIPDGWEVDALGAIEPNIVTGKTPSTNNPENFNGSVPFICIGDVRGNMHITKTELTLSDVGANSQEKKYIPEGAICVTCIASPGLVGFATENSQTNQQLNTVVCSQFENRYFLYFYLKDYFRFAKAKTGNTFANMNKGDFSAIKVIHPKNKLLVNFAAYLKPTIEQILINSKENKKLIELRDWLLPMLMNGQVTVKDS